MNFNEELILSVVENGVFALIFIAFGFWVNKRLEKFKSEQSLEEELNKLRVGKIGECFAIHSKYGKLLNGFIESLNEYRESDLTDDQIVDKLMPKIAELKKINKDVALITASHRFWLGDEIHKEALKFNESFPQFCDVFHKGKFQRCVELKMKMDQNMMDVDDIMWMLTKKINQRQKRKS